MTMPVLMGIINVTPDSFSGDGLLRHEDYVARAVAQATQMVADGAGILDIGGESSRPGSTPVPADEEIRRVVPVVKAIREKLASARIAVDTVKASVAEASLEAGADIVNDISALQSDARMAEVIAKHKAFVVLMHNRAMPGKVERDQKIGGSYLGASCTDAVSDVAEALKDRISEAQKAGIAKEKIILDPGIGFGKTVEQNLALIARLEEIKALGYPVLVGLSRKSFIGRVLDAPVEERLSGTAACHAIAIMHGADILRVHDVNCASQVARMAFALKNAREST